ncbi:MAG: S8 family serine peptidase [Bdellovibrionaceae bacterium]|nr:S8 family serine peptidase [Pseudobdellovibrionaceae bacterium]
MILSLLLAGSFSAQAAEYLVKKKTSHDLFSVKTVKGMKVLGFHEAGNLVKVDIKDGTEVSALIKLYKDPSVEYVVKNFRIKLFSPKASEIVKTLANRDQWAIKKVNAEKAWELAGNKGSKKVIVAVIDTGVELTHESLASNIVDGYDYLDGDDDPTDTAVDDKNPGHGTHCAGIIGATGTAANGILGASPLVSIMPLRFISGSGGDLDAAIKSIDFAIKNGAKVISASWGAQVGAAQAKALIEAIERADKAGLIFISAAGNSGKSNDKVGFYPVNSKFPNVIGVAASGSKDEKPQWSNYGRGRVDIAAPGLKIISTLPGNKYGNLSGTSMATPLVAGAVALLLSQNDKLTGEELRSLLQVSGAQVDIETACNCRIDMGAAMESLVNKKMFVAPATKTLSVGKTQAFHAVFASSDVKFESSNPKVATIDEKGVLTAVKDGVTRVSVTDAQGNAASSLDVTVGELKEGSGGGGGGSCPIGDPALCEVICKIFPIPGVCPGK